MQIQKALGLDYNQSEQLQARRIINISTKEETEMYGTFCFAWCIIL